MSRAEKCCFDRWLPSDSMRPYSGRMVSLESGPARAAFQIGKLWPNGTTLRIKFLGGTAQQQALVKQFAVQWPQYANLIFDFSGAANAQIRIAFEDDGAWSYIGKDALGIPSNQATMNLGWQDEGVILHEFGHMLGMAHEHQNPRDNPIQWNKPVVNAALSGSPNFWDQQTIDHNMYAKYDVSQINGSALDPKSVMLYSFPASWTLNGFSSSPNNKLSAVDKQFAALVYPKKVTPAGPPELPIFDSLAASIGKAGEEDLFRLVVTASGRYTVETVGSTDVIMTLLAPNGSVLAQDDDSGDGRNARIAMSLDPGEHLVQVRHYNSSGGTGQYGIRAVRG